MDTQSGDLRVFFFVSTQEGQPQTTAVGGVTLDATQLALSLESEGHVYRAQKNEKILVES